MTRKTLVGAVLAVSTLGAVVAGSGSGVATPNGIASVTTSITTTSEHSAHNQADVTFAQQMIPHHAQASAMATLVPARTTNPKVIDLASRIQSSQNAEIQQMKGWLTAWGVPASPGGGMPGMPGMGGSTAMMPGMMSQAEMTRLGQLHGPAFDHMWLQMMIRHHQGAIEMARTELAQGRYPAAKALAHKIITEQRAQIKEMKGLLDQD